MTAYGAPANQSPAITAGTKTGEITLDGALSEPDWQTAPTITLTQQNPHPSVATPFTTTVRILRGTRHIYFGIVSTDLDASKIAVHTLQRDGDQSGDDNVMIVLDSFGQKKLAYVFQVNAGGAMADGLISPGYTNPNAANASPVDYSWNGYWEAAVKRTPTGWTAEIAINTQSLQFNNQTAAWGLNVSRYVPRDQLTLAWSGINLNASPTNLQWEGTLAGIQSLSQGSGFEFDPYALTQYDDVKHGTTSKAGFDLKYNVTPELAGLFTYHTDFAEAEANTLQANISRFPAFIPETRAFFLDGSNIFTFSHNLSTNFIPFYSRSVGLVNGEIVPLDEGAKLLGHAGPWTLGFLDTQMAGTDVSSSTNLFAGRAAYNINNQWSIGALITRGDPLGQTSNTLSAFDSTWSTSTLGGDKNLNISGWGARSLGDIPSGNPNGYGFDLEYPNDLWYADFNYNLYGDGLDPALGFLP
ncbi:MAG: carbohydrate binding family 9 domain-containing protein, partial [Gammaproteobacteria bacterium]